MNISSISNNSLNFGKLYIPGLKSNKNNMAQLLRNTTDYNAAQDAFKRIHEASGDDTLYLEMKPLDKDTIQLSITDSAMLTTAAMGNKVTYSKQTFNLQDSALDGANKDNFKLFADRFEANYVNRQEKEEEASDRAVDIINQYQL